jgi:hypothetical protein
MNCSQLLERRPPTNWEKPAQPLRNLEEHSERETTDTYRWSTVRFSVSGQTFAHGLTPSLKHTS